MVNCREKVARRKITILLWGGDVTFVNTLTREGFDKFWLFWQVSWLSL